MRNAPIELLVAWDSRSSCGISIADPAQVGPFRARTDLNNSDAGSLEKDVSSVMENEICCS
jgi:hypothetical protein